MSGEDTKRPASPGDDDPRAPYEPPRLECESLFEVIALACGKVRPLELHVPARPARELSSRSTDASMHVNGSAPV